MAKEIALSIKVNVNGTEKVISNIQETENAVKALREELATTSYGSARFDAITADLQKLRAQLENVDKATEGLGVEKRLRAINDATNLLTGSFSLLTGALTLASANEEDLVKVQQAEAKAMAAVNIVLGVRAISEGLLESRVLRREAAEKISIATSKIYIATAKGISATLKAVGINAGVASTGVRALTSALAALGIPALIVGLGLLYDYLTDTNEALESRAPMTAKEYYDELSKSIDELNTKNQISLENFKASGASEKEVLEQKVRDTKSAYDKLNQANTELWNKYGQLTGEALRNEDGFFFKSKTNYLNQAKVVRENIDKISQDITKADTARKNAEKDLTDFATKQEEERVKKAKEAADKIRAIKIKDIQDRLAIQLKYIEYIKGLGDTEIKVDAEVLERVKKVVAEQDELINLRVQNAKTAREKLDEQLEIDIFKVIPSESEKRLFQDTFLQVFNLLNYGIQKNGEELVDGRSKTFKELLDLSIKFAEQQAEEIMKNDPFAFYVEPPKLLITYANNLKEIEKIQNELKNNTEGTFDEIIQKQISLSARLSQLKLDNEGLFTDEAKKSLAEYFNLYNRYVNELSGAQIGKTLGITIDKSAAQTAVKSFIDEAQNLLTADNILSGDVNKLLDSKILETFKGLGIEIKKLGGITDPVRKEEAEAYNKALLSLVETYRSLSLDAAKTKIEVKDVGEELGELTRKSFDNASKLQQQGIITEQVLENTKEKLKTTATESSDAFLSFVQDLIENKGRVNQVLDEQGNIVKKYSEGFRDKYLKAFSPSQLIELLQAGASGLEEINFETEKQITDLINNLTQLELELGDSITTTINNIDGTTEVVGSGYANFAEIIEKLKEKLKELQEQNKDTSKSFEEIFSESKFKKIADMILSIFTDLSQRISDVSAQQSSLMLEKLEYEKEETLAKIGEANTKSDKENKKILEERAKIEKQYAKDRFEAEKKARIQELQFGLANALAQSAQAIINTYATLPTPAAIPFSLLLAGITAAQIAVINDQIQFTQSKQFIGRRGGLIQGATHEDGGVPALLEGGEFVMSRAAVDTYGDTLGMMNASVGARPLAIDDSRIVQAIAKQNTSTKVPLKTYVLYNDIQNTEKLNNKIEQLARL